MLSEILIGVGCFLLGSVIGSYWAVNMVIKVNRLYEAETGNNFVSWIFDKGNDVRKARAKGETPVLKIQIKDED
jgi:hypothetical protein